ncbi:MAG: GNAT family N-acetyltransferase [Candidatus Paceibacterota bacterium]
MEKAFNNISKSIDTSINNLEKSEKLNLRTEIIDENEWENFKKIRLEAIENEPMAFYVTKSSKEKENNKSDEEWQNELINENSFIVLSKNNDIPVGMIQAICKLKDKNEWHIRGVYLNKDFRGSGCGKDMMNLTLDEINRRGGKVITLNVIDTQEVARKIYEKLGFEVTSRFEKDIIDGIEYPGGQWMIKNI